MLYSFADLKTQKLSVYIPTLKNGGLLRNILLCQRGYLDGQKALIYAACRGVETERVISYPSEAQKCCSIIPRGTEKAGKKSLAPYPLFVAIRMAATLFQLVVDTVL